MHKGNYYRRLTYENKFGRRFYCQRAARFIRHEKQMNNKKVHQLFKKAIQDDINEWRNNYEQIDTPYS